MELIRKISKPTAIFLSFYMLMLACPHQSLWAAMIDTESIIDIDQSQRARDYKVLIRWRLKNVLMPCLMKR